ncbi:hypothetical protein ACXM1Q_000170 [Streptococcus sp. 10F2]
MRPKKYPYSKQRYQDGAVTETWYTDGTSKTYLEIAIVDTWTGKTVGYRHEVREE